MLVTFFSTLPELIHEIALLAVQDTPCITPITFRPLHLICRMTHATLSLDEGAAYSILFLEKFDISSPRRHLLQDRLEVQNMEDEVKQRYIALQIIRRRDMWNPNLVEAFATIYVMLLEDDGRNWEQVLWAGLPTFIPIFMRERLLEGASDNHGWPLENELNTLAITLFWLISSRGRCRLVCCTDWHHPHYSHIDRLDQETDEFRKEIMTHLAPFAFAGFRVCAFPMCLHRI
jgi:hypothetical protein